MNERYIALDNGPHLRRGDEVHIAFENGKGLLPEIVRRGRLVRAFRSLVIFTLRLPKHPAPPGTATYCGEQMAARLL